MRVLLISDVHANLSALRAVEADAGPVDWILFAGDAVNYGPDPAASVDWLDGHAAVGVRGNHDHAVAFAVDPKASPAKEALAITMRDWTRDQLDPAQVGWLLKLPRHLECRVGGAKFELFHGTPVHPLYDYRLTPDASDEFVREITAGVHADVLLVGHTHLPLLRRRGDLLIVNPGSVGQPLDNDPRTAYAIWEDGQVSLRRVRYDQTDLLASVAALPLPSNFAEDLSRILRRGSVS